MSSYDTLHANGNARNDAREALLSFRRATVSVFDTVFEWMDRRRQRRLLESLPEHLLQDIGVSRVDALREAGKPFWEA